KHRVPGGNCISPRIHFAREIGYTRAPFREEQLWRVPSFDLPHWFRHNMSLDGKTLFVTGGAGFIGSALIRYLLDRTGASVVNIDKLTYAANLASIPQANGHKCYAFAKVDICNGIQLRALFDRYQPHAIVSLAAESHVDRSIDGPDDFIQTNIVGTFTLLQEALRCWRSLGSSRR